MEDDLRILLINPTKGIVSGRPEKPKFQTPPLGLLYLAGVLEENKYNVEILDAWSFGLGLGEIRKKISDFKPHVVGITAMTVLACDAYAISKAVKEENPSIATVMGGPHATALPEEAIADGGFDIAAIGEGEYVLRDICNEILKDNGDFSNIDNIVFKKNGKLVRTYPGSKIDEVDNIPFPAYHLLPRMDEYNPPPHWGKRGKFATIITSRGCPYGCSFCSVTEAWGKKYRYRSPDNVFEELEILHRKYGISFISFRDSVATLHKKRMIEICKGIIERKLKIEWNCNARTNEVDEELLGWMKKAGCKTIMFGIESGNEKVLANVKNTTKKVIEKAISLTHKSGIIPHGYFMFGLPGETKETMSETIEFAKSLKLHQAGFTSAIPFPGSKLWDYSVANDLIMTKDWTKYDMKGEPPSRHLSLKSEDILIAQKRAFREFYLRPKIIFYQLRNIKSFDDLLNYAFEALINLLKK